LLCNEGEIEDQPAEHSRTQLHERLDVDVTEPRQADAGVELPANVPVVDDISAVPASSQLALIFVAALHSKRLDVDISRQRVGDQDVGGQQSNVVPVNE